MGDLAEVPFIIFFEADEDTMIKRIMERSKSSGRDDDNEEVLRKRFHTYLNETMPIVEFYDKQGKVKRINALKSIDEVFGEVEQAFAGFLKI